MHKKPTRNWQILSRVIGENARSDRTYKLVRFSLPDVSSKKRSKLIVEFLNNQANAIGIMEWWVRGAIIKKNRRDFQAILVLRKDH